MKIVRPTVRNIALAAALLSLTGCVSTDDVAKLQSQISQLEEELANMKRTAAGKDEVQNVNLRIAEQTETLLKSNTTLVTKVGQMDERLATVQGNVEQSSNRIDRIAQQVTQAQRDIDELERVAAAAAAAAAAAQAPPPVSTPGGIAASSEVNVPASSQPAEDPVQLYQAAYRDYQRGNFDLAIGGFQDFLSQNPSSELSDNASYWIAESLFSQKKYREAIQQFNDVVTKYPKSDKVPGSLLKKGYAYLSIGERAQGIVQLQYVVHEHASSQEASLARQRLKQLGVETR
jgi:tol-pal system protein YbgF